MTPGMLWAPQTWSEQGTGLLHVCTSHSFARIPWFLLMRDLYLYRSVHHYTPSMPPQLARQGEGRCIVPSDLHHHWQFLGPCCFCLLRLEKQSGYKKSATFVAIGECHTEEYVALCAMQECLYFGELLIHYFDYMS